MRATFAIVERESMHPHDRQRPPAEPDFRDPTQHPQGFYPEIEGGTILQLVDRASAALKRLPKEGQIIVVLIALILGFSLITTLFKLINLILSLALLGVFGYIGYKFISASDVRDSEP